MSILAAISMTTLGLAASSSVGSEKKKSSYHIAGDIPLPNTGLDSMDEAREEEEAGLFLTQPFSKSVVAPAGLALEDERISYMVWEGVKLAPRKTDRGYRDPVQRQWLNKIEHHRRMDTVNFFMFEGGARLYVESDPGGSESGTPLPTANPYLRHINGRDFTEPKPRSRAELTRKLLGQTPYHFILLRDGSAALESVSASSYNEAIDKLEIPVSKWPILLVVREGRQLHPEDWTL